jgi:hypothetical protein
MAKKQTVAKATPTAEVEEFNVQTEVQDIKEVKKVIVPDEPKKEVWEVKDRTYFLNGSRNALTYTIKSKNIYWFDEELGYEREIKYTTNQKSPFVDEFKGPARLGHIVFTDGVLTVPKEKQTLQKLLSLYHPDLNKVYAEFDAVEEAEDELDIIEMEIGAMNAAMEMELEQAEAILRTELGNKVSNMSSKEVKRDLLIFARRNPVLFLELANDENIEIRNKAIKAVEQRIISLSSDNRTFAWAATGRKLITVPFDENPFSALAAFFKTDEGIEVYQTVEKRVK